MTDIHRNYKNWTLSFINGKKNYCYLYDKNIRESYFEIERESFFIFSPYKIIKNMDINTIYRDYNTNHIILCATYTYGPCGLNKKVKLLFRHRKT